MKRKTLRLLSILLVPASLLAQTDEGDVYELSPFEIDTSKDVGYLSSNSVSGSRVNTAIRNLPVSIQVLNQDFLDDIGANDWMEASRYATNAEWANDTFRDWEFTSRGFRTGSQMRNFVQWTFASVLDNYSTERIEIVRGPNSVLYGLADPGGVLNISTKRAVMDALFGNVQVKVGSNDLYRATFDANTTLVEGKVALRINGLVHSQEDFRKFEFLDKEGIHLASTVQVADKTRLLLEYEQVNVDRNKLLSLQTWNGVPITHVPAIMAELDGGRDGAQSWVGPDRSQPVDQYSWFATLQHEFSENWHLNIGYQYLQQTRKPLWRNTAQFRIQRTDGSLAAGGDAASLFTDGGEIVFRHRWDVVDLEFDSRTMYFNTVYDLESDNMRHKLTLGGESRQMDDWGRVTRESNPANGSNNYYRILPNVLSENNLNYTISDALFLPANFMQDLDTQIDSLYVALQGDYLGNRLHTLLGARHDDWTNKRQVPVLTSVPGLPKSIYVEGSDFLDEYERFHVTSDVITAGAVYEVNEKVNLYGTYSESFFPDTRVDIEGNVLPPEIGEGYELGIKFDLFDGRLTGLVNTFHVVKSNTSERIPNNVIDAFELGPDGIEGTADDRDRPEGPRFEPGIEGTSDGYEFEIIANPTPGWTLSFNFANTDARRTDSVFTPATIGRQLQASQGNIANLFTRKTFQDGPMKGFVIGGGVNWRDDALFAFVGGDPYFLDSYSKVNLLFGFNGQVNDKLNYKIRLNIDNVFDEDFERTSSFTRAQLGEPMEVFLSTSLQF